MRCVRTVVCLVWLVLLDLASSARLLRRSLSGYPEARCNDGSAGAYYHDQDVGSAGRRVMVYLPDGGDCSTVEECTARCSPGSPERVQCTSPRPEVLERRGGVWGEEEATNPFHDYFKVYLHSCSSDAFSGVRPASPSTGGLHFQGRSILTAALQDLVKTFGINLASEVVLVGSGSGARGVGYNCDFLATAIREVNSRAQVRCIADSPDMVPWWVRSEECGGRGEERVEQEERLWGRRGDASCVEENKGGNASVCGVWSRYQGEVSTPLLLLGSQLDPRLLARQPCLPDQEPERSVYLSAWRRGVVALYEAISASSPATAIFAPSCAAHALLAGGEAEAYLTTLEVPLVSENATSLTTDSGASTLLAVMESWLAGRTLRAIDPAGQRNPGCASPAPQLSPVRGLRTGVARRLPGLARRLAPPLSLFPAAYRRRCSLDTSVVGCGYRRAGLARAGLARAGLARAGLARAGLARARGLARVDGLLPESAVAATTGRSRLWRRYYYLQYLKLQYNRIKQEYLREYRGYQARRPTTALLDYDYYDDYSDYSDYYDYDYKDNLLARIVKAVKDNKEKLEEGAEQVEKEGILTGSVQKDFQFPKDFLDSLPPLEDLDFDDFDSQVETVERRSGV